MSSVTRLSKLQPQQAADELFAARQHEQAWLDAFTQSLDRRRTGVSLARVLATWDVSQAEAARLFGVSRQAVSKWLAQGAPAERAAAIADLAAATDLLVHYLKRDRISAVVRRPVPALDGASLLDLIARGETQTLLLTCRAMFDFERVVG